MDETAKTQGQKALDLNKEITAQMAAVSQMAQQSAAAAGVNPEKGERVELTPADVAKDIVPPLASTQAPVQPNTGADSIGGMISESDPEQVSAEAPLASAAVDSLENYDSTVQDINKASDVSIFKQLSNRYILNYTKIFERKKLPTEPTGQD